MPKVTVTVPHDKPLEEAAEKIKPAIEKTIKDFEGYDAEINWTGCDATFKFKSMAFTIKGKVVVDSQQALVEVDLPFAAMMFKDRTEKAIRKNLTRAIEA